MAHFAQISDGIVTQVIVINNSDCGDTFPASESIGQGFIESLGLEGEWLQTSYNHTFRRKYAGIGSTYDATVDEFVSPAPHPSWSLDSDNDWQPPTPMPLAGMWSWDEPTLSWVEIPE